MSFTKDDSISRVYAPGYFLAHEECVRETKQIAQEGATATAEGGKFVKAGTIYPANDETAEGIVYEDVDVTSGDMPGSVVTAGVVFEDRLPQVVATAAHLALDAKITFQNSPSVTRP